MVWRNQLQEVPRKLKSVGRTTVAAAAETDQKQVHRLPEVIWLTDQPYMFLLFLHDSETGPEERLVHIGYFKT